MYDDSTPIGGNFSSARGNFIPVSKSNPCPHCGKPDWCYFIGELSVCNRDQPPATGWEATSKTDKDGKVYYARPQEKKPVRPAQTRYWEYPDRDGSRLVRVKRIDFGDGRKKDIKQEHWDKNKKDWVTGYGSVTRDSIPVYRYAEVREAITKGKLIFLVDGEQCADILWQFNLAATTSIGGMGKFSLANSVDLQGAQVVIAPDRDEPGVKDADKAAEYFPDAKWLYPFPEKSWEHLPKSDGLDIFDWIGQENLSPSGIRAAIGEKKIFKAPTPQATSNVVPLHRVPNPPVSELGEEIDELLGSDLKKSQLQLKISELAQKFRMASADIWKIYREQEAEQEQEANLPDIATDIEALLVAHKSSIALTEVLPAGLAQPIEKLAAMLNLRSECYLAALLTQVASLFKVGTETILRRDTDWRCVPNYNAGIVAEVSQLKTPIPKAIIDRPMRALRERAQKEFEQAQLNYETELNNWKAAKKEDDRGPAPKPPRQRIYSFDKTTGEGIIYQQAEFPDQAMMYFCDELAGIFKSGNQYRGGKGSDEEDMLSFWNGTGTTVLRALGVRASVEAVGLSIFGTIQPDVLAGLLKDCSDSNGKFARFDFVIQPLAVPNLPEDDSGRFDLTPMLVDLYQKIDALPAICFEFTREAKEYHRTFTLACHKRRVFDEPKQGLRGALGKMPEKVGKLATIIHTLTCVFNGQQVSNHIPQSAVEAAVKFVKFAADQVATLYTEFSDRVALAPNLVKIISLAERNSGTISGAKIAKSYNAKLRPTNQEIREWLNQLASMKYGEVTASGRNVSFSLSPQSPTSPLPSKPYIERVESVPNPPITESPTSPLKTSNGDEWGLNGDSVVPISKSLPSKGLKANGDYGDSKNHFSENSDSLRLSHTTEPAELADEHHAKMLADKMREAALLN